MADPFGFLVYQREEATPRPVKESLRDYRETYGMLPSDRLVHQAERCMDCGIPFCEVHGCPAGNLIPEWISMVTFGKWKMALDLLHSTDNFPEFTCRLCAAPCEAACVLSIYFSPVTVKQIELQIAERGWREGWIVPEPAPFRSGKKIAVVGSGPAGLAAAQQLVRSGHGVAVFDRESRVGGILRYGIPDFALEKPVLDRRIDQLIGEGVTFKTGIDVGADLSIHYLRRTFDVIVLTTGSRKPRDVIVPGRSLGGVHFAMDFLIQQNRRVAGKYIPKDQVISGKGARVAVIGGGEAGAYCIAACRRDGAKDIVQIELEPEQKIVDRAVPRWPDLPGGRHAPDPLSEARTRLFCAGVEKFVGNEGNVSGIVIKTAEDRSAELRTETVAAELVILALGFMHAEQCPLARMLSLETDEEGNLMVDGRFMTSEEGVFAAEDCTLDGSSVVQAISRGRLVAEAVNRYLSQKTDSLQ